MHSTPYALIPLTGSKGVGKLAFVDADDYGFLSRWSWHLAADGYAAANITFASGDKRKVPMHRLILGSPIGGMVTDHANRNRLDNRRTNLRVVDYRLNYFNAGRAHVAAAPTRFPKFYAWVTRHGTWSLCLALSTHTRRHAGTFPTRAAAEAAGRALLRQMAS